MTLILSAVIISSAVIIFLTGCITPDKGYIKYAEFNASYPALKKAMQIDIESHGTKHHLSWIDSLSYLSSIYYDDFSKYKEKDLCDIYSEIQKGRNIGDICRNLDNFTYYKNVCTAVLGGLLGEYEQTDQNGVICKKYGLTASFPIAKGFAFSEYDDFGASRTYGYARKHLGHDLLCEVGTPITCIEDGIVECLGWNQYGGWRLGIRSKDKKRYYYYAHLRKNKPYHKDIYVGKTVRSGEVIGYAGRTGYSTEENVNNIEIPHLHMGLELVFDESQKESDNEIWVDVYSLCRLLCENRVEVVRDPSTKEFYSLKQQ